MLDGAEQAWRALVAACTRTQEREGRRELAASSEALLEIFERLTERYERSLDAIIA